MNLQHRVNRLTVQMIDFLAKVKQEGNKQVQLFKLKTKYDELAMSVGKSCYTHIKPELLNSGITELVDYVQQMDLIRTEITKLEKSGTAAVKSDKSVPNEFKCNQCGYQPDSETAKYCPNCGSEL